MSEDNDPSNRVKMDNDMMWYFNVAGR